MFCSNIRETMRIYCLVIVPHTCIIILCVTDDADGPQGRKGRCSVYTCDICNKKFRGHTRFKGTCSIMIPNDTACE